MRDIRQLRTYQDRVVGWLYERDAALAVLEMGAGKTVAALTAIAELLDAGAIRHALIVAPKRVAELVWPAEVAAWSHLAGLRLKVLAGSPVERFTLLDCATTRQVSVIGFDNVEWLAGALQKLPDDHPLFDLLLIDETSRLKSPVSKRAKALLKLASRFRTRWGLTGTPRPNSERDLFMQAAVISAGRLWGRSFSRWQQERFRPLDRNGHQWTIRPEWRQPTLDEFSRIAITLDESDMPELPDINTVLDMIDLPADVIEPYRTMQRRLFAELEERDIEAVSAAVATGKLAQMANGYVYGDGAADVSELHTLKLEWLREIVDSLDGQPLLIAYEFKEDVRRLRRLFGDSLPVIGGGTSSGDAARHVGDWNAGILPLLALHPASAGHGLNLQAGGSHLAWLGLTWSAELYEQTIKRIHRPGQAAKCTVHLCLARGTVDELKRDRVIGKLSAQEAFRRHLERI